MLGTLGGNFDLTVLGWAGGWNSLWRDQRSKGHAPAGQIRQARRGGDHSLAEA